ncbi:MAG TPA: DUF5117 domain-containing protein, partial [Sediminibacterium sp.]|nr:DUF5117 domain-containing protein [Sediminibacterium sp.]
MKKLFLSVAVLATTLAIAQQRDSVPGGGQRGGFGGQGAAGASRQQGPKPYKDVITSKAETKTGLFTVHKVDDHYYFEIPDSILGREVLAVTRFHKVAGGGRKYGGEEVNEQTLQFEKGPGNTIFLRVVTLISTADSTNTISQAVKNSYLDPIAHAFPIAAYGKDSLSTVVEVTDFFKGDNQVVSLDPRAKRSFGLGALAPDRSYVDFIHTYPINTEVRTVKTYTANAGAAGFGGGGNTPGGGSVTLPAA